jgi:hypothetical protein
MRSSYPRAFLFSLLLGSLTSVAWAQSGPMPSLLPLPPLPGASYPVRAAAATDANWYQGQAPVQTGVQQSPSDKGMSGEYSDAMKGGYEGPGCTTCNSAAGCCHNHYVYANALLMTHDKRGGFVTSLDAGSGNPEVFFCAPEFGRLWHGGFEIGTGWCFGCDCNSAIEAVYWGLFPADGRSAARGNLNSTIDFGDLNHTSGNANVNFTGAQIQEVRYGFDLNNVEINLLGNGCCGGPFGCGMCGCCMGRAGSPWGFGWLAGFRYINFSEDWSFNSDTTDDQINGDPTELSYNVQLNNNLFGFQLGTGLSYCVTERFTAYVIGKMGIYNNYVTQTQRVFGPGGSAIINNGPFTGDAFLVDAEDDDVAFTGQIDLGGRWAVNDQWSVNFGYRALGLAGVAISETNIQRSGFQNLLGIADTQTDGSFIVHGGYVGATYCW